MGETKFSVEMSCGGCGSACERILKKVQGVEKIDVNLEKQEITVSHSDGVDKQMMLEKLSKWGSAAGKKVSLA